MMCGWILGFSAGCLVILKNETFVFYCFLVMKTMQSRVKNRIDTYLTGLVLGLK